jgi:hypothetical protein
MGCHSRLCGAGGRQPRINMKEFAPLAMAVTNP